MAADFEDIKSLKDIIIEVAEEGEYKQVTWKQFIRLCKDKND